MCEIERHQYIGCTCSKIYEKWTKKASFCEFDEPGSRCIRDDRKLYCGGIKLFDGWCPDCLQTFSNTLSMGLWDDNPNFDSWLPIGMEMVRENLEADESLSDVVPMPSNSLRYPPRQPPLTLPQNLDGHTPISSPAIIPRTPAVPMKKTPLEERPIIPRPIPKYQYPFKRKPHVKRAPRGSTAPKVASPKPRTAQKRRRCSGIKDKGNYEEYVAPQKRVAMSNLDSNPTGYLPPVFGVRGMMSYPSRPACTFEGSILSMPAVKKEGKRTERDCSSKRAKLSFCN